MTLTTSGSEIADFFEAVFEEAGFELLPRYNVAPSQEIPVIVADEAGSRRVTAKKWGLVPSWAKDPTIGNRMINARSETAAEKPSFRSAMRRRRCIVPADGFYEWAGKGPARMPHLFRPSEEPLLSIAGLYEQWVGEGGEVIESCTLLTTSANRMVGAFHHRMPVLLGLRDHSRWLDRGIQDPAELSDLLAPAPETFLLETPVSKHVNNPRNDDPACLEPLVS